MPEQTPGQTVGPFFGYALPFDGGPEVRAPWQPDAVRLHGVVLDGAGSPVPDAMIEVWGADGDGRPSTERGSLARDPNGFTGFGRSATSADGHYAFSTVKPGVGRSGVGRSGVGRSGSAPYVVLAVFARGLLHHLLTRAYFGDEPDANATDPLLRRLDPDRRGTLVATVDGPRSYRLDLRLQGPGETVFLDYGTAQ
ncbi:protocatechuate 3,4-dioxygenase subunit alpha [Cellulomonas humilata]|uniref:Protocatechuate 3,4-dioxygenase subunit alpha n=1 Tax=Cellulomonas humilata TaxID=144055 RepID=A0A7Y5ZX56_9CELL|nr:protocatechuate 3,4-dioxygenase subunit alpha [Cellulomonas humilata]NUU15776.1 protocatechuate 3,4-dioxygenase subunit alpha [Cellulomonas humilata]